MGLLDNTTHQQYYQGNDYGNYQFVSLNDVIAQFEVMYVGEDKLIPKAKRADIAFHAHRALAELSFDTFRSHKSQEIELPPSLTMILPHDYVNYTKVSFVDSAGIKHPLYPTKHTSNPFEIKQLSTGEYEFGGIDELLTNGDFSAHLTHGWEHSPVEKKKGALGVSSGILKFTHHAFLDKGAPTGSALDDWQEIDVSNVDFVNISADGVAHVASGTGDTAVPNGQICFGLSTMPGDLNTHPVDQIVDGPPKIFPPDELPDGALDGGIVAIDGVYPQNQNNGTTIIPASLNASTDIFDVGDFLEWNGVSSSQEVLNINVSSYNVVYALVTSNLDMSNINTTGYNSIDNLSVNDISGSGMLQHAAENGLDSTTWSNYKANVPSENAIDDYRYEQHWLNPNERYGLSPEHAQINGNFYIDQRLGKIHFSSNINGRTIILDYISDSLGTDDEMQVHKLAEDAMYKQILYQSLIHI